MLPAVVLLGIQQAAQVVRAKHARCSVIVRANDADVTPTRHARCTLPILRSSLRGVVTTAWCFWSWMGCYRPLDSRSASDKCSVRCRANKTERDNIYRNFCSKTAFDKVFFCRFFPKFTADLAFGTIFEELNVGHTSVCSHLYPKRQMRWAQVDRWGHVAGGLGAIRAVCRAWQAFRTFLALGILKANPWVSATSPGMVFPRPPGEWVSASLRG